MNLCRLAEMLSPQQGLELDGLYSAFQPKQSMVLWSLRSLPTQQIHGSMVLKDPSNPTILCFYELRGPFQPKPLICDSMTLSTDLALQPPVQHKQCSALQVRLPQFWRYSLPP